MKHKKPPLGKKNERLVIGLLAFVALLVVGAADYEDEINQQERYCAMVKEWNDHAHLPKEDRPGWPPYNGEEQCYENY